MTKESVFDKYAHEYDLITNAGARLKPHGREVDVLIERYQPTTVLDAGCANGLTSFLFARRGIEVVGLDRSRAMIAEAKKKYAGKRLLMSFLYGNFERLPKVMDEQFDLIVCLANAVAGLGTVVKLREALTNFKRVLKPGGSLVIQALNYEAVKEGEVFPVKATQKGKIGYLRYVRRRAREMELTLVRLDMSTRPFGFEVFSHPFESFLPSVLADTARSAGFGSLRKYGNLILEAPFRRSSRDFILLARKPV